MWRNNMNKKKKLLAKHEYTFVFHKVLFVPVLETRLLIGWEWTLDLVHVQILQRNTLVVTSVFLILVVSVFPAE